MASILLRSVDDPRMSNPQKHPWQDLALCAQVGSEVFFPGKGGSTLDAKIICSKCDVLLECLRYAIKAETPESSEESASHIYGIFGGLSAQQRTKLRKMMQNDTSLTLEEGYRILTRKNARKGPKRGKLATSQELQAL